MRSLRFRLTLWFSLAVTVTAGLAAAVGYFVVRGQMMAGVDFLLEAESMEIVARMGDKPQDYETTALFQLIEGHTEIDAPQYYFQVHRPAEGVMFRSRNLGTTVLPDLSDGGPPVRSLTLHDEPARMHEYNHHGFHVQVATSLEQVEALLDRFQRLQLFGLPVLFAFSLGIGWALSTAALGPIRAMHRAAGRISATNLAERLPVPAGQDEVAALARLLNDLFSRLENSFEQVKRFTADASHEIKTPLSLIRLHAERLAKSPRLGETELTAIEEQLGEIARLNKLVENLLLLARTDAGGLKLERRWQNPAHFVRELAEDAAALAEEGGRRFVLDRNDEGEANFDQAMIRQVALNLLANALRYTPAGKTITMNSRVTPLAWDIVLDDEGPGVPPEKIEAIFGRFVRGPVPTHESTTESGIGSGGSGLGLAIVRGLVEAHGGTIHAANRPEGGLRVTVRLPMGPRAGLV